jgi:phosphomannomutase
MAQTIAIAELMERSGVSFGTSGARGLAAAMTDRVCYAYTAAFLQHLLALGEIRPGTRVALAGDLRPSTPRILAACTAAVEDAGFAPVHCGAIPTPAVANWALREGIASLMVTGSHIPDDRNGIKFYRPAGEILKADEAGIRARSIDLPGRRFASDGVLLDPALPPPSGVAHRAYVRRYRDFFPPGCLSGRRVAVYEHSTVAREAYAEVLGALGADTVVTPVSSNTALERSGWFATTVRTRIGSPFVIEGMQAAPGERVVGYEANGGFLTRSDITRDGRTLPALPTRDALIVPLAVLGLAAAHGVPVSALAALLPPR